MAEIYLLACETQIKGMPRKPQNGLKARQVTSTNNMISYYEVTWQ